MDLFQEIINSGKPDEVVVLLRKAMGLKAGETLCREAIGKFLDEEGISLEDACLLRLYLEDNNLLEEDLLED